MAGRPSTLLKQELSTQHLCGLLADFLYKSHWMLATAESCTGGLIAAACTDLAGSSNWFERGFVSYSNAAKTELLGVDAALIEQHGAVSEPVVTDWTFNGASLLMHPNGAGSGQWQWLLKTSDITLYLSGGKWNGVASVRFNA